MWSGRIDNRLEQRVNSLAQQGIDVKSLGLDWRKMRENMREAAVREVRASLILGKVAEAEAIAATNQEVDQEVERIARQEREPTAAMRKKLSSNGMLDRIASHIATEKTLNFLFEHATKVEPTEADKAEDTVDAPGRGHPSRESLSEELSLVQPFVNAC